MEAESAARNAARNAQKTPECHCVCHRFFLFVIYKYGAGLVTDGIHHSVAAAGDAAGCRDPTNVDARWRSSRLSQQCDQ